MAEIVEMSNSDIQPSRDEILENLGIPSGEKLSATVEELLTEALKLFNSTCRARAAFRPVTISEFSEIYHGEGLNDKRTPLGDMYERALDIVLFALTIGGEITDKISDLFLEENLALAGVLDATASAGAETAADRLEAHYCGAVMTIDVKNKKPDIYRFAPGYCGWHITGQKKLFRYLEPQNIGITLLPSFLMSPLKSLSGAIIVTDGSTGIKDAYDVCRRCGTHWCRTRKKVLEKQRG